MTPEIVDPVAAKVATDEAVRTVDEHADDEVKAAIMLTIRRVCEELPEFFSDDVWSRLPEGLYIREPRVMGPLMRKATKARWCTPTGAVRSSMRPGVHKGLCRVYRSRVFHRIEDGAR